jgi:hypothetical protein
MTLETDVSQIKQSLAAIQNSQNAPAKPQVMGTALLTSSNQSVILNPSYYYSITMQIVGGTATNTNVYVQLVTEQTPAPSPMVMNQTVTEWKIHGIHCNKIYVDTNTIGSSTIVIGFIGYDNPQNISVSI